MGFEPTQGDPSGLAVHRLNRSATLSTSAREWHPHMGHAVLQTGLVSGERLSFNTMCQGTGTSKSVAMTKKMKLN